ncbi:MAG: hypothetical protein JWQ35_173 [Bacteriovoracaceae bacterium]|nr:hypothetical protein [Bacteriovoracaceae bacterium]
MISFIIAFAVNVSATDDLNANEVNALKASLSETARTELNLVDRIRALRTSVEKLPDDFKASGLKSQAEGTFLTKQALLTEVENMELTAADRWSVLLSNTAYLDRTNDSRAFEARRELISIPKAQSDLERRIDEVNLKMRDGELLNLASKVMLH